MKSLKNEFGFSMVQGMVLAGVIAGSSLVATRMITDQKKAQKGAETRDLIEELHNVVYTVLQNKNNCKETMVQHGHQIELGSGTQSRTLNTIYALGGTSIVQVGSAYMNNNVKVKSINLSAPTGSWRNVEIVYERLNSLDTNAATRTKSGYGAKELRKTIALRIQKEPLSPTTFSSCYAVTAAETDVNSEEKGNDIAKQLCEEMNSGTGQTAFVWDEALSICKPNAECPGDQIYTGIDSTGSVKCRNLEEWIALEQVLDPTPPTGCGAGSTVRLQIDNTTKKVRMVCN